MKKTSLVIIGCILVGLLAGCSTTPYQPLTGSEAWGYAGGGGFSQTQLAPDEFRIHFEGSALTGDERSQDFCLLRAAELSLQKGFPYFAIIDQRNVRISWGTGDRPSNMLQIKCFKNKPNDVVAYEAASLQQSLKQKYGIK